MQRWWLWSHISVTSRCPRLMTVPCFSAPTMCPMTVPPGVQMSLTLVCRTGAWSWLLSRGILTCPPGFLLSQPSQPVSWRCPAAALKSEPCQDNCSSIVATKYRNHTLSAPCDRGVSFNPNWILSLFPWFLMNMDTMARTCVKLLQLTSVAQGGPGSVSCPCRM